MLNDEKIDNFQLRSEIRKECPISLLQFIIIMKVLDNAIREEKN